jgi:hypothetical protein
MFDAIATVYHIDHAHGSEWNPIADWMLQRGRIFFVMAKGVPTGLMLLFVMIHRTSALDGSRPRDRLRLLLPPRRLPRLPQAMAWSRTIAGTSGDGSAADRLKRRTGPCDERGGPAKKKKPAPVPRSRASS